MARWSLSSSSSSTSSSLSMSSSPSSQERSILIVSTVLFSLSTYYLLKQMAHHRESDRNSKQGRIRRKELTAAQLSAKVSDRCLAALSPAVPYYTSFVQCLQDPYQAHDNPTGYIALCMAENKLVIDLLTERLLQPGTATAAFSDPTVYGYTSFLGLPVARQAAAYFLAKRFLFPERHDLTPQEALSHINPSHVAIGSGLANLLHSLFFLLGNGPGESNNSSCTNGGDGSDAEGTSSSSFLSDACLIPAPYYAAFESDMQLVAGITPFAVHMANPQLGPSDNELDLAYMQAKSVRVGLCWCMCLCLTWRWKFGHERRRKRNPAVVSSFG
jgi:hypothetical protein